MPSLDREEMVSTGGAELPERVRAAYDSRARSAATPADSVALSAQGAAAATRVQRQVREAFALATRRIYGLTALLMVAAAILSLRIPDLPLRTTHDRAAPVPASGGT
jgi:hypothetical protein